MSSGPAPLYGCSNVSNYVFEEKLGEGTFGEVHRARHKPTDQCVALKEILLFKKNDGMPITALREIKILKSLDHPNIIEVLDMAVKRANRPMRERAVFYMATPYMDHDLAGLLQNEQVSFKLAHIKCYMKQLLEGMAYLHAQSYMHRDVKAANILIDNAGRVKIADFGLARKFLESPPSREGTAPAAHRYTGTVVTRWYRSPELLLGEHFYTTAIDMWGIGCVFGEFFKRHPILAGKSDADQLIQICHLIGFPTEETMPNFSQLPGTGTLLPPDIPKSKPELDQRFANVPQSARDLMAGLLRLNPLTRLTASGALEHPFFTTEPLPALPHELPVYASSHEMDARKRNAEKRQVQQQPDDLPTRPAKRMSNGFRRKALGFKLPHRPMLSEEELIPPYRRQKRPQVLDY